ncbi:MAG: sulfatase [Desulfobacteraceae bacterium]|nr:sulfatase [Desulfobacteraceae bacterium]
MFKAKGTIFLTLVIMLMGLSCSGPDLDHPILTAKVPLHLEDHIKTARIENSEVQANLLTPVAWHFDEPITNWKPVKPISRQWEAVRTVRADDALRLLLTAENRADDSRLFGEIYVALPDWNFEDWAYVEITAQTSDPMRSIGLDFNYTEEDNPEGILTPFYSDGDSAPLITDGTAQTYRLSLAHPSMRKWEGSWTHLGIWITSQEDVEEATLDILSVKIIPKESIYADAPVGVRTDERTQELRRTLYTHAPGRIEYRVRIPQAGRLDVGLGVLREDVPVTFRIVASQRDEEEVVLFEETYSNPKEWAQRSVDLSSLAGKTVNLVLEAEAEIGNSVALWAAPTLTGVRFTKKPNVIFYIIDGAGADLMSVYGYKRRTTPNLERIAAKGAVFERAYSNASWTQPSTLSFMTSLQYSVASLSQEVGWPKAPDQVLTMAQHMHRAGYQTAVLVSNSYAGRISGLDRGVDKLRDFDPENNSTSTVSLHRDFWTWREDYPAEPYWVHFQTTDVHTPWRPVAPFAGLFVSPTMRQAFNEEYRRVGRMPGLENFKRAGIDRVAFYQTARGVYDEAMAHQDYQLGRLVKQLKAKGEWEHTLLIVAADHSHFHAGLSQLDPLPPALDGNYAKSAPIFSSWISRVPLIVVWPERISAGLRFSDPVSMIDMLPTILDLLDLPMPELMQGQSLAPLLLGKPGWEPRPVILDEIGWDRVTGKPEGRIEVIDGRWGASLYIHPEPEWDSRYRRPAPLLIYDLWNDPYCLHSQHKERPDLVKKYRKFLKAQWKSHQSLAKLFSRAGKLPLTPDQLKNLRSLGYIR